MCNGAPVLNSRTHSWSKKCPEQGLKVLDAYYKKSLLENTIDKLVVCDNVQILYPALILVSENVNRTLNDM